jgi:hypothetical protein
VRPNVAHLAHFNRKSPGKGPVIEKRQTMWEERVPLRERGIGQPLSFIMSEDLALQLSFCFEVRTLSDRLVSSAP